MRNHGDRDEKPPKKSFDKSEWIHCQLYRPPRRQGLCRLNCLSPKMWWKNFNEVHTVYIFFVCIFGNKNQRITDCCCRNCWLYYKLFFYFSKLVSFDFADEEQILLVFGKNLWLKIKWELWFIRTTSICVLSYRKYQTWLWRCTYLECLLRPALAWSSPFSWNRTRGGQCEETPTKWLVMWA